MATEECTCSGCEQPRPVADGPCPNCGETGRTVHETHTATVQATASVSTRTKRGDASLSYFTVILGLAIAVWLGLVAILDIATPLKFALAAGGVLVLSVAILDNGKVHNFLLGLKAWWHQRER